MSACVRLRRWGLWWWVLLRLRIIMPGQAAQTLVRARSRMVINSSTYVPTLFLPSSTTSNRAKIVVNQSSPGKRPSPPPNTWGQSLTSIPPRPPIRNLINHRIPRLLLCPLLCADWWSSHGPRSRTWLSRASRRSRGSTRGRPGQARAHLRGARADHVE